MRPLVLDTSVAIAWYLPEAFAPAARSYQKQLLDGRVRFVVPSLHFWEMANVLRTYVKRHEPTPSLAQEIHALHLDAPLAVEEPTGPPSSRRRSSSIRSPTMPFSSPLREPSTYPC